MDVILRFFLFCMILVSFLNVWNELFLCVIKVIYFMYLGNLLKLYKIRKILRLYLLEVIMGVSLKIKILNYFVMNMVLNIIFLY